ncbi:hypothetical protein [Mucisphaera sp.]|uniref:hypothetical protein n=1 Tax=Mucisphaera sp. TaxID=2913024 RepID=UPI003D10080A
MRYLWMLVVAGVLVGCGERSDDGAVVPVPEAVIVEPAWRWIANDGQGALTEEQELVLAAVRRLVEERREANWRPVDYLYELERGEDGNYRVFLRHLVAYRHGVGLQTPGGHEMYWMDAEGSLVDYIPGR